MVKAQVIEITGDLVGQTSLPLPEYKGLELLVLRGGIPMISSSYENREDGGIDLLSPGDKFLVNEKLLILPQLPDGGDRSPIYSTKQYPHIISCVIMDEDPYIDDEGNWQISDSSLISYACRAEPNNKGGFIIAADGKRVEYEWTVYLPIPATPLKTGTPVTILLLDGESAAGKVKRYNRGTFNARIWL